MTNRQVIFHLLFLLCLSGQLFSQHNSDEEHQKGHEANHETASHHARHLISASINHTIIFSAVKNGSKASITLPSFGLNYTYWISNKWGIGLHNDIIIEDFLVKGNDDENNRSTSDEEIAIIERGTPVSSAIMILYKPIPFLGILAGAGREFSSHEDYTVIRFGVETPIHLPNNWELFGLVTYDINIDAYESLTYGIGIGKLF